MQTQASKIIALLVFSIPFISSTYAQFLRVDDSEISGINAAQAKEIMNQHFHSGNLLKPDRVLEGVQVQGLAIQFVRLVKGHEVPVEGLSFKAQLPGSTSYNAYRSDEAGVIRDAKCESGNYSVSITLQSVRYQVSVGNAPYEIHVSGKCGVAQKFIFEETTPAGQAVAVWQTAVKAEKKLLKEASLAFWKRQIPSFGRLTAIIIHQIQYISH